MYVCRLTYLPLRGSHRYRAKIVSSRRAPSCSGESASGFCWSPSSFYTWHFCKNENLQDCIYIFLMSRRDLLSALSVSPTLFVVNLRDRYVAPNCDDPKSNRLRVNSRGQMHRIGRQTEGDNEGDVRVCVARAKVRIRWVRHLQLGKSSHHPPCVSALLSSARGQFRALPW